MLFPPNVLFLFSKKNKIVELFSFFFFFYFSVLFVFNFFQCSFHESFQPFCDAFRSRQRKYKWDKSCIGDHDSKLNFWFHALVDCRASCDLVERYSENFWIPKRVPLNSKKLMDFQNYMPHNRPWQADQDSLFPYKFWTGKICFIN